VAFVRLYSQGRTDLAYPSVLARYAVAQYRAGRDRSIQRVLVLVIAWA
jgi:hypothetical protein